MLKWKEPELWTVCVVVSALAVTLPNPAFADGFAEVSPGQRQLNDEAVAAVGDGDLEKAVRLFRASLDVGELNITWLNLGRTLAKLGRCSEAVEAYDKTLVSPQVAQPSPEEVRAIIGRYRVELEGQCDGEVKIACDPVDVEIRIDDGPWGSCPTDPVTLTAGGHLIEGRLGESTVQTQVEVRGLQRGNVSVSLFVAAGPSLPEQTAAPAEPGFAYSAWGWSTLGTGMAVLAAALVFDVVVVQSDVDALEAGDFGTQGEFDAFKKDLETEQTLNLVAFGIGGALTVSGLALLLLAPDGAEEPLGDGVGLLVLPAGGGGTWTVSW